MDSWQGKNKALTFSFDDGVLQDERAIGILDKYGLKATFNLNSGVFGTLNEHEWSGGTFRRDIVKKEDVKRIYEGHEVAVHTVSHPNLVNLSEEEIVAQVENDRITLEDLVGYEVRMMAYPCGPVNSDERVAEIIKNRTKIRFARSYQSNGSFDLQDNLLLFSPTVYFVNVDEMYRLADKFFEIKTDKPQIFYIWGHTYEIDMAFAIDWKKFEEFCKYVSGKGDIFYGTNGQVFKRFITQW